MTKLKYVDNTKEMLKLESAIKGIQEDKRAIANSLFNELLFMGQTLNTLRIQIESEGPISMFEQGKQKFLREHPALKGYNTTVQRYSLLYKQLNDILPSTEPIQKKDELLEFIEQG